MSRLWTVLAAAAALQAGGAFAQDAAQDAALEAAVKADYDANLAALFDDFHQHPELSGLEVRTSGVVADQLEALGYQVTRGVGGHGVVAVMRNGQGPTILVRADMDGLPIEEASGVANPSRARQVDSDGVEKPVMHACGHDVHVTALIGTARQLAARRDRWSGTLVLVGQPAEERIFGARAMMQDGLYERFPKPDYAVAFHVSSGLESGKVVVPLGAAYSSSDSVDIRVHGVGAHGASPHKGIDPVLIASQIVVSLQSVVSRTVDPLQGAVITVGSIHGGIKHNIIPETVDLQLTVRSDDPEVRTQLLDGVDRVARGTALALGVPEDKLPTVTRSTVETTPPTVNDAASAQRVRDALIAGLGADRVVDKPREGMGAEDFSYFITPETGVEGVYFAVGGTPAGQVDTAPSHHSPLFRIEPEPAVRSGVEATVTAVEALAPRV
ncbi:amidohydrolase [Brevundimonas albigilva]|uniref:Amidohydrolase n=1 Tax=Brevundimonas albigilva TaxID=1312364 RepID=A0ABY4SRQ1_9CAUL|nr:amidohydrolase [Brevundimonas albigilva]UQV18905.1 amidohydrolase [Brevundimonas albigilva]URI16312.1 amidohydrolase [Brevundimonas albigilva]